MSLEQAVQSLTQTTENLLVEVNTRKLDLDAASSAAEESAISAAADASKAQAAADLLGSVEIVTTTGTVTLTSASAVYQLINPNGANRDVVLADLTAAEIGYSHTLKNTGTAGNSLTVKNAAGTRLGPLVANGYSLAVVWTGAAWEVL